MTFNVMTNITHLTVSITHCPYFEHILIECNTPGTGWQRVLPSVVLGYFCTTHCPDIECLILTDIICMV